MSLEQALQENTAALNNLTAAMKSGGTRLPGGVNLPAPTTARPDGHQPAVAPLAAAPKPATPAKTPPPRLFQPAATTPATVADYNAAKRAMIALSAPPRGQTIGYDYAKTILNRFPNKDDPDKPAGRLTEVAPSPENFAAIIQACADITAE